MWAHTQAVVIWPEDKEKKNLISDLIFKVHIDEGNSIFCSLLKLFLTQP